MPYRGACTDATKYGTSACPDNCVDSKLPEGLLSSTLPSELTLLSRLVIPSGVANMYGCTAGVKNNGGVRFSQEPV